MPIVENTLVESDGVTPLPNILVHCEIQASGPVFLNTFEVRKTKETKTDSSGKWQLDLVANSLLTPNNTTYRIKEYQSAESVPYSILVPNSTGPHPVVNLLVS